MEYDMSRQQYYVDKLNGLNEEIRKIIDR